jgi:catechol 2,3-dioxygenase-like lactoylglutathione lyase family enzyme
MKRTWTIIGVRDVAHSFKWYQSLFGQRLTAPAHSYFGQLLDSDGTVLLCLHEWGAHEHPSLTSPDNGTPGNGLLLFFRVDDYSAALRRARDLVSQLAEEPHVNPATGTKEFAMRDPDGYYVMISALSREELAAGAKQQPNNRPQPTMARAGVRTVAAKPQRRRG